MVDKLKTYRYRLVSETEKSVRIAVPSKKGKIYPFDIPKFGFDPKNPIIKKIEYIDIYNRQTKKKDVLVDITMMSDDFYKFTWFKIQRSMFQKGYSPKHWDTKRGTEENKG